MKVCDNGVIRDMTPEEETAFYEWHENMGCPSEADEYEQAGRVLMGVTE